MKKMIQATKLIGTGLITTSLLGTGISYYLNVKHFSTSKTRLAEEDKGKRKATEKELEQMQIENQKNTTEVMTNLDEQERKDIQKAMEKSKREKDALENSTDPSNEQASDPNAAGPSNQQADTYQTTTTPSEQTSSPEAANWPGGQAETSESNAKYDTIDKFAKTPVFVSDPDDELDPEFPYHRGMEAEVTKSLKVWDEMDDVEISDPKSNFIPKYLERQLERRKEAQEQANSWWASDEEKSYHNGRAAAIGEIIQDGYGKWTDLVTMFAEERDQADEGLGRTPTPPVGTQEEALPVDSAQNNQEASQDQQEPLSNPSQNNQEVSQNVEPQNELVSENAEPNNETNSNSEEPNSTKKRKRDSDDEGDGPSGGGISPSNRGTDDYPEDIPNWGSSNQKIIFLISSIMSAICDAISNLPF